MRFVAELLSENPVFCQKVIDSLLLSTIDPTGEDQEQELPWLQKGFHVSPNAVSKDAASGISRILSGARKTIRIAFGKGCYFSHMQFG